MKYRNYITHINTFIPPSRLLIALKIMTTAWVNSAYAVFSIPTIKAGCWIQAWKCQTGGSGLRSWRERDPSFHIRKTYRDVNPPTTRANIRTICWKKEKRNTIEKSIDRNPETAKVTFKKFIWVLFTFYEHQSSLLHINMFFLPEQTLVILQILFSLISHIYLIFSNLFSLKL